MKYPKTLISLACSLIVLGTACLSPRAQEIVKAAAPLAISLSELGEVTGHLPPGSTVAVRGGTAIISGPGSTAEKIVSLKDFGLEQAVKEGALKEGDVLIVDQAGTQLIQLVQVLRQPAPPEPPATGPVNPLLPPAQ